MHENTINTIFDHKHSMKVRHVFKSKQQTLVQTNIWTDLKGHSTDFTHQDQCTNNREYNTVCGGKKTLNGYYGYPASENHPDDVVVM